MKASQKAVLCAAVIIFTAFTIFMLTGIRQLRSDVSVRTEQAVSESLVLLRD